ncbi:YggT family protein [Mangrovibrevibacter kandeliae]|uniref:YggT family protein n=1 Tax=Mangrovibrevibacter kandeliae TaxID=2968473 RepID=UPI0021179B22|nr:MULTISPECIES: YggT family protein [unclassified Aurantimonas]MCQ8781938.1 YggT family protein [Aurantimonas sp. CSK15Z-1]MCW4115404.1 YggT family protein [Aurantimonas sp. MSK8Z-1]
MQAIAELLLFILNIYWWIVILSAILSWLYAFNIVNAGNPFVDAVGSFLYRMTEPLFRVIRRFLPNLGGLDLSPLVVLLGIFLLQRVITLYVWLPAMRAGI